MVCYLQTLLSLTTIGLMLLSFVFTVHNIFPPMGGWEHLYSHYLHRMCTEHFSVLLLKKMSDVMQGLDPTISQ